MILEQVSFFHEDLQHIVSTYNLTGFDSDSFPGQSRLLALHGRSQKLLRKGTLAAYCEVKAFSINLRPALSLLDGLALHSSRIEKLTCPFPTSLVLILGGQGKLNAIRQGLNAEGQLVEISLDLWRRSSATAVSQIIKAVSSASRCS